MKKSFLTILFLGMVIYFGVGVVSPVFAYNIQKLANVPVENDFTLGPGKIEVFLDPGSTTTRNLLITNRLGKTMDFKVEIEDFEGSPTGERAAVLLGGKRGPYSLKDYLHPELSEFTLAHGERMVLPVEISIPEGMEPGGLYGSVLISTSPPEKIPEREEGVAKGQVRIVGRVGTLFFVRTKGEVNEEGALEKFDTTGSKRFYQKGPISFTILYRNTGNVHLDPYGIVEIKNILGKKIGEIEVEPYFAMPKSLRYREVKWERGLALGHYTATLFLNRGYQDIIDTAKINFWIFPWKILLIAGIAIFSIIWFIWWIATHFEIRRKS
ncbi:hypothetical protein DRZ78_01550 [Candidatus Aerophobetes bacterium]|uniref:DUF916 domain-containing protein n=1 Tax=Aerophobetes bacterium TaxID=2030807 RepID=A0A662D645_UNCAE|nr:MAG: hypothetical protein DRZ78_01550 [Candidatus Aerophobetes bacterium]